MEDTLKPNNLYSLSILFSADGCTLSISDEFNFPLSSKKIVASISTLSSDEICTLLKQQPEIEVAYKMVRLVYESDFYTVIPASFFRAEEAMDYLKFQEEIPTFETVLYNEILDCSVVNIFSAPKALINALETCYPTIQLQHHLTEILGSKVQAESSVGMHVWIRFKKLDIILLTNGNLQLANSYPYNTPEDVVYYVLNVFDKLQLEALTSVIYLHNSAVNPALQHYLQKYVKEVVVV